MFHEVSVCECMCRQAGAICSPQGPRSNQSINRGGARLISHPSSLPSFVPKTDALGNKANQYTSSQSSPPAQSQDIISRLSSGMSLVLIRHHHLVYMVVLLPHTHTHNDRQTQTCNNAYSRHTYTHLFVYIQTMLPNAHTYFHTK